MKEALDELRSALGDGERVDFSELVTLGAQVKTRRLAAEHEATDSALRDFAERVRNGSFAYQVDIGAADEVKRLGLIANYDE